MNVRHLARHVLEDLELAHPDRTIELKATGSFDGYWDQDRLTQLLTNLIENALRYGAADAPVTVELVGTASSEIVIRVHNQGEPIPEALLPRIFDPFRRGDTQEREGLGLGLFIARLIVEAHGGKISVRSEAAFGTEFVTTLPRRTFGMQGRG